MSSGGAKAGGECPDVAGKEGGGATQSEDDSSMSTAQAAMQAAKNASGATMDMVGKTADMVRHGAAAAAESVTNVAGKLSGVVGGKAEGAEANVRATGIGGGTRKEENKQRGVATGWDAAVRATATAGSPSRNESTKMVSAAECKEEGGSKRTSAKAEGEDSPSKKSKL